MVDITARYIGIQFPFETVERCLVRIPDVLQLKIAYFAFPSDEASIRLYSCLANGSVDEYNKGEQLYKSNAVREVVQIGFHLSSVIALSPNNPVSNEVRTIFRTSVMFDRRKITACSCSCTEQRRGCSCDPLRVNKSSRHEVLHSSSLGCSCGADGRRNRSSIIWCSHVVALCLFRINEPSKVELRTPISETLGKLERNQLQKFAQFLISKLPVQNLTVAQQILDELLSTEPNDINMACGAPDPTAGGSVSEYAGWLLEEKTVEDKLAVAISEFVRISPQIYSDITNLTAEPSPISNEYLNLLRPLRGHEPEGLWNLLQIVRHMFRRQDSNALVLLQIISRKILDAGRILLGWFQTKLLVGEDHGQRQFQNQSVVRNFGNNRGAGYYSSYSQYGPNGGGAGNGADGNTEKKYASSALCDEMVALWRIGAMNPALNTETRSLLCTELVAMHKIVFDCVQRQGSGGGQNNNQTNHYAEWCSSEEGSSLFTRFRPAIEACLISWEPLKGKHSQMRVNTVAFSPCFSRSDDFTRMETPMEIVAREFPNGNLKAPELNSIEDGFARAEALHAHGYATIAVEFAKNLCQQILENSPIQVTEISQVKTTSNNCKPTPFRPEYLQCEAISQFLTRSQFLLNVLGSTSHWPLAFRVCFFALDMPRPPSYSKFLEVKLVHQERETAELLRKLPQLKANELDLVREKAKKICSNQYSTPNLRPPLTLAHYCFETLNQLNTAEDRELGFQAAKQAIGFKLPVCETDHPMLYESFRHQRGELVLQLLNNYKDDQVKLDSLLHMLLEGTNDSGNSGSEESVSESAVKEEVEPIKDEDSSALEDEQEDRAFAARLRCVLSIRGTNQLAPPGSRSGPDSSAPETTSSDNSPTCVRRGWRSVTQQEHIRLQMQQTRVGRWPNKTGNQLGGNGAHTRLLQPTEPNQPSEASAQFTFELAKSVLEKAGGNTSQAYFQRPVQTRPHAALQMAAFQIGLHALSLHNAVNTNWLNRHYSTYVSWIIGQAIEIGVPALRLLIEAWEGHLTPSELAKLADQAGRVPDRQVIRASVELAYRALEFASCLTVVEVRRALDQCEEMSLDKVKSACLAVEQAAANGGNVPHDVLFATAEKLLDIYHKLQQKMPQPVHQPVPVATHAAPMAAQIVHPQAAFSQAHVHHQQPQYSNPAQFFAAAHGPYVPPYAANQPYVVQFNQAHYPPLVYLAQLPPAVQYYQQQQQEQIEQMGYPPHSMAGVEQFQHLAQHHQQQQQQQQQQQFINNGNNGNNGNQPQHQPHLPLVGQSNSLPQVAASSASSSTQPQSTGATSSGSNAADTNVYFLMAAIRVGMLAMEQIRRYQEEKPVSTKVSKAPPPLLGNVKWLFHTAALIGNILLSVTFL